jgi:hypothetical protein
MELRQMRLFVQSKAESGKFQEVSRVLHLAVNFCSGLIILCGKQATYGLEKKLRRP